MRKSYHASDDRVAIRIARLPDLPELLRLIRAYYRFDHIRFNPRTMEPALARLLRSPALGRVWVMREGAKSIGYAVLTFNYDLEFDGLEGLVTDLFVDAEYRGSGLGKRALEVVDDYCRQRGIRVVELQVEVDNSSAQAFYRRIGFRKLSRIVMMREIKSFPPR